MKYCICTAHAQLCTAFCKPVHEEIVWWTIRPNGPACFLGPRARTQSATEATSVMRSHRGPITESPVIGGGRASPKPPANGGALRILLTQTGHQVARLSDAAMRRIERCRRVRASDWARRRATLADLASPRDP